MAGPLTPTFDLFVRVRLDRGFVACAGPLMGRCVAYIRGQGATYAQSPAAPLSAAPQWSGWTASFVVPAHRVSSLLSANAAGGDNEESTLWLEVEDGITGRFLGRAHLDLCDTSGAEQQRQLMLEPRFVPGTGRQSMIPSDAEALTKYAVDDFGFVTLALRASLVAQGPPGSRVTDPALALPSGVSFPVGCALRVTWLCGNGGLVDAAGRHSVRVSFGQSGGDFTVSAAPLFVSVGSAEDCVVAVQVSHQSAAGSGGDGANAVRLTGSARFRLPLNLLGCGVDFTLPVVAVGQSDPMGLLVVNCSLLAKPEVPPPPVTAGTFERSPPDVPPSLFHPVAWESEAHVARSTERRWRRSVVVEAAPQADHVRHLFDVVTKKAELSASLIPLVRAYYNIPPDAPSTTLGTSCDLRQLLCSLAFACPAIDPRQASHFVFDALDGGTGFGLDETAFLLEHALLPRSLDFPISEVKRRATDLMMANAAGGVRRPPQPGASSTTVLTSPEPPGGTADLTHESIAFPIAVFDAFMARNWALWYALGATLQATPSTARADGVLLLPPESLGGDHRRPGSPAANNNSGARGPDTDWRHLIVRTTKTGKAFAVTAHRNDTFRRVAKQIEDAVHIPPAKQRMVLDRNALDIDTRVGSVIDASTQPVQTVHVAEADDTILVTVVYRSKAQKWTQRIDPADKVLKLRATVQQRTNIPLSRLVLSFADSTMWDRHPIAHYGVFDGAVIDVVVE